MDIRITGLRSPFLDGPFDQDSGTNMNSRSLITLCVCLLLVTSVFPAVPVEAQERDAPGDIVVTFDHAFQLPDVPTSDGIN